MDPQCNGGGSRESGAEKGPRDYGTTKVKQSVRDPSWPRNRHAMPRHTGLSHQSGGGGCNDVMLFLDEN